MGYVPRDSRKGFRRAIVASVVIHVALAAIGIASFLWLGSRQDRSLPGIDTRINDVALWLDREEPATTLIPDPSPEPLPRESLPREALPPPPEPAPASVARPPVALHVPNVLPAELLAILHRSQPASVPVGPATPVIDPNGKPASATSSTPPLHGAMKQGQSVVYVLDCSGSMGEFGKLGRAQAALVATLRRQPEGVRFQIITYNSTARPLLPGGLVPTTGANVAACETRLATLEATGRSNHVEAVRLAASLRPDAIVMLTDAGDLSAAKLKSALAGPGKPVPLCVAEVTADGAGSPKELR